jgi:hypothetical protein
MCFCAQERLFLKLQTAVTSMERAVGSGDAGRIESERQVRKTTRLVMIIFNQTAALFITNKV